VRNRNLTSLYEMFGIWRLVFPIDAALELLLFIVKVLIENKVSQRKILMTSFSGNTILIGKVSTVDYLMFVIKVRSIFNN
jgi:hypothetical protein